MWLDRLQARLASAPNRIALSSALRGTIATAAPLAVLPAFGVGDAAHFAVIGALNASFVDAGGAYGYRLAAMAANSVLGPATMLLGGEVRDTWWLAAPLMFGLAFAGGLARTLGPAGIPLGLNVAIAFLIGVQLPPAPFADRLGWTAGFLGGGIWTICVALAFWQLRPYRRMEQEVASVWEAVAGVIDEACPTTDEARGVVARRRHERRLVSAHYAMRDAIERSRLVLGETRAELTGPGTILSRLLVLWRAASRIGAAVVALDQLADSVEEPDSPGRASLVAALRALAAACRSIEALLLHTRGAIDFTPVRGRLDELTRIAAGARAAGAASAGLLDAQVMALAQAVRHLDNAEEMARAIYGAHPSAPGMRRPLLHVPPLAGSGILPALASVRTQLTFRSPIFRHALRAAVVTALGTAAITRWSIPHGFWLPMTALVILQPDYSGTMSRALQRTGGTLAGAVLAAALLAAAPGTLAYDLALVVLLFGTFLVLRRRYAVAMIFLTPLIILLLAGDASESWSDLEYRIVDTLVGAALAIGASYLLWPLWERVQLDERMARALKADAAYIAAVLGSLAGDEAGPRGIPDLRRDAEIAAVQAQAAFQRMLAEPRHQRARISRFFSAEVYVQRLTRHAIALALAAQSAPPGLPADSVRALRQGLESTLGDIAAALAGQRAPEPLAAFYEPLERLRVALAARGEGAAAALSLLLGQIVSDTTSLHLAAASK